MLTTREAAQLLERQDNILILTHRRPDGDTIGCAAGLCAALRLRGKEAYILPNPDVTAVNAVYAAPYWAPEGYEPSFVVSVDIAARSLFFPAAEAYFPRIGLAIDHHPSFEGFGAAQCVDPSRAACGEMSTRSAGNWGRSRRRLPCPSTPLWPRTPAASSMPTPPPTPIWWRQRCWPPASTTFR